MKRLLIALMIAATSASMVIAEAEAKRLGGGGSFGRQSSGISRQATPPAAPSNPGQPGQNANQATNSANPATAGAAGTAARPASPWRNILGGALLGLGLGALLSQLGIGGLLASIISAILTIGLIVLAVMLLLRLFRGRHATNQPAYAGGVGDPGNPLTRRTPEIGSRLEPRARPAAPLAEFEAEPRLATQPVGNAPRGVPADFDVDGFLRHAKTYFIRLQSAWDRGEINDIREFTSPEIFSELRLQLQERGASPNATDVVSLDAELLGIETTDKDYLASVRFHGMIKESEQTPAAPFSEIWNLAKPISGQGGWVLAGIEQPA